MFKKLVFALILFLILPGFLLAGQHDGTIANGSGSTVRTDIQDAIQALLTCSSGATEPSTTYAYQLWADTTTGYLKQRNSGDTAWIKLYSMASGSTPTGSMAMWATTSAPTGWLLCDGSAVSRTTYADLFAVISTTYGVGDGSTTFNLPDFKDRLPRGKGSGTSLADTGGAATYDLSHTHTGPSHTHTGPSHTHAGGTLQVSTTVSNTGWSWDTTGTSGYLGASNPGTVIRITAGRSFTSGYPSGATAASGTGNTGASGTGNTGSAGSATQSTLDPYLVINYIIKY